MPRRSFDHSAPDTGNLINMNTKKPVARPALPIVCERIRYYRERLGMEQKALASAVGISGNAVSNWENGRTRPDINLLPRICETLHITFYELFGTNDPAAQTTEREQLLLDKYRMLSDGHRHTMDVMADTLLLVQRAEQRPAIRRLLYFERGLAAGIPDPTEFEDQGEPVFLYQSPLTERADWIFSVSGDSMEPAYHDGDRVLVSRTPARLDLQYGEVGAFIVGNETYIKIYEQDGLHSLNQAYPTIHFTDDDNVYLIGRVVGILKDTDVATPDDVEAYALLHPDAAKA